MSLLARILLRAVVLGGVYVAYLLLVSTVVGDDPEGGADIGVGLLAFAGLTVGGFLWALYDARRLQPAGVIACWLCVGALVGVVQKATIQVMEDGVPLTADLGLIPFAVVLVGVPAAVGAAIGAALRRG